MATSDPQLRAYLLGRLSPAEMDALENRYVEDDALRASIEREDEALTEAYLDGRLDDTERAAFERLIAQSPARRRRVDLVRGLRAEAPVAAVPAPVASTRSSWYALGVGLAAAAVLVLAVWSPWRRQAVTTPAPAAPTTAATAAAPPAAAPTPAAAPAPVLALTLAVPGTRGGRAPERIELPPDVALDLSLVRRGAHWAGRAITIRDVDRGTVWRGVMVAGAKGVADVAGVAHVPAGALPKGDYVVAVGGVPDARYTLFVR